MHFFQPFLMLSYRCQFNSFSEPNHQQQVDELSSILDLIEQKNFLKYEILNLVVRWDGLDSNFGIRKNPSTIGLP